MAAGEQGRVSKKIETILNRDKEGCNRLGNTGTSTAALTVRGGVIPRFFIIFLPPNLKEFFWMLEKTSRRAVYVTGKTERRNSLIHPVQNHKCAKE